jgi:hypothetical protein
MANIADFKAHMLGGGARPNQFQVQINFPSYVSGGPIAGVQAKFLCKAAQLPASTVEDINILYRGRPIHFAGERTFQPWTVTIYTDVSFNIRNAMEQWQAGIQNYGRTTGRTNPLDYQVDLEVYQLDRNGAEVKSYKFTDAYPTNIGAIALDYEQQNQIETFDVEFTYNYFTTNSTEGNRPNVNVSIDTGIFGSVVV